MRDGEDGPVLSRSLQGLEDLGFCERIEVGRDFIEQEDLRVHDDGPGDGQELTLAAGEEFRPEGRVQALRQGAACFPQADEAQGFFHGVPRDPFVFEAELVGDGATDGVELLFNVAEDLTPQRGCQLGRVAAEDADLALPGPVEAEDELEEGTLAGAGAAGDGDHFPGFDRERDVVENGFFPVVAERDVVDDQRGCGLVEGGTLLLGLDGFGKEVLQAADAGDGRLDVLDFHADAL